MPSFLPLRVMPSVVLPARGILPSGPVTTVFTAFEETARAHRDKPFLHVLPDDVELTYGEAQAQVEKIATRYAKRGYGRGHRVALKLPNGAAFLLHFLALNRVGASAVPLNPDYRASELDYVLGHSQAALVVDSSSLDAF